jgi:O-antigen/teichoic acid export membrane protein
LNKKNFLFFTLPSVFNVFIGILLLPLYTQILGPEEYGLIAIITTILGLVLSLSDNGSGWVLASNFHEKKLDLREINFLLISSSFSVKILLIAVFYFFGNEIISFVGRSYQDVGLIYNIILFSFVFTLFDSVALSYMILSEEAKSHMFSQVISAVLYNITLYISLFSFDLGVMSLVNGLLVSRIFLFLYFFAYMQKKIKISFNKKIFNEVRVVGFPAVFKTTSAYILSNIDKIFIQQLASISTLGIYDFGLKFKSLQDMVSKSFSRVYGAYFYKTYKDLDHKEHMQISDIWLAFNFLLSVLVFFFIDNTINFLTNGKFNEASIFVQLFFVSSIINAHSLFYGLILIAERQTKFVTIASIYIGILSSVSIYFSIIFFGVIGVLYVFNIASLTYLLVYIFRVKNKIAVVFNNWKFTIYLFMAIFLLIFRNTVFDKILNMEDFFILSMIYISIVTLIFIKLNFNKKLKIFFNKQKKGQI